VSPGAAQPSPSNFRSWDLRLDRKAKRPMAAASGEYVLLVDDDPDIRETFQSLLEMYGLKVVTASDGAEAFTRLRGYRGRPCVILLDLMMPGMNGYQFREAQLRDPDLAAIPIVIITCVSKLDPSVRGLEVLSKPIHLETLLATVQRFGCEPN
jgi:CheY-like chemotaxis protein